jgi:hypothetical protein
MSTPERMGLCSTHGQHARRDVVDAPVGAPLPRVSGDGIQAHRSLTKNPADNAWLFEILNRRCSSLPDLIRQSIVFAKKMDASKLGYIRVSHH